MSLIHEFDQMFETRPAALKALNDYLDSSYDLSRYGQWINGKRSIPTLVVKKLREALIESILRDEGIILPNKKVRRLMKRLDI